MNKKNRFSAAMVKEAGAMSLPAIIESFFMAFAGLVDSYMVSALGPTAVAAVGLTAQPKLVSLAAFIAISVAVSALVARRMGQKKQKEAEEILLTAVAATLLLTLLISASFLWFTPQIMTLCGSTPETHDLAASYFRIIMAGMVFNALQMVINSAQRGAGNTRITMRTNVTSAVVNILFNYLLIGGNLGFPAWGIRGAAVATVLGSAVAALMSTLSLFKKDSFLSAVHLWKNRIRPTALSLRSIVHIGYGVFFEQVLMRIGFMSTAVMAAHQGTATMAAHQVAMNIMALSFSFGDGLQSAAVALIGRSLGEGKPEKARDYGRICQWMGGAISVALSILYLFGGRTLMRFFFKEADIVEIGARIMLVIIFVVLFQVRQVVYSGCLRGAGDTLYTAVVSAVSVTVIRTLVSYVCGYTLGFGIIGIWMGVFADQISRFMFNSIRFRGGKWANIKI